MEFVKRRAESKADSPFKVGDCPSSKEGHFYCTTSTFKNATCSLFWVHLIGEQVDSSERI